ncbi:23S rRNA (guanine(748)-N(1))-methyltransferase [Corynebacterium kalinowskii]|uniref:23S rRNA (Guanine(748)-N(1))-methyltransferase n=1 Tax=Corynebacterium kalinowskii TaxID=2675216 RepID=A0A6B8VB74_9CORY|nr:methyltransferase domain-containing protein [Corynebacterium kalinowskii]QGU02392.1 23S rRNA (guanine(748)-N(1))-methyltransferase [Corynebacterium kalinowskii]
MLRDVIDILADPTDGSALQLTDDDRRIVSDSGHSFDIARQGYVTLAGGEGLKHTGDDADMIASRETFLSGGYFAPFVEAVSATINQALDEANVADEDRPAIVEIGAGTGYYLAHALDDVAESRGVGIDISVPAAKHLAKCHPRAGAVVADAWQRLPIRDRAVDVITVIFAPRNPEEFARILKEKGQVIVLTAHPGHLDELREPLGIIGVEPGKIEHLMEKSAGFLERIGEDEVIEFPMELDRASIAAQIGMSPSARHIEAEDLERRIAALPEKMIVTAKAQITRLRLA